MIKKPQIVLASVIALIISFLPLTTVAAQENLIFGQNHAYSVYVKSNEEAFIFARLVLTNPDEKPMTNTSFTLSNAKASEMSMYQVVLPQECAQYNYESGADRCVRYKEPSYTDSYGYYGGGYGNEEEVEYYKINYKESDGKYSFDLPKPVDAYKSTAIVAIYATKDYVSSSLDRYSFDLETLKVDQRVTESRVAVTAETDYRLKNPDRSNNYPDYGITEGVALSGAAADSSFSNPDIDKLVYEIGSNGQLNKTFKSVTPNESVGVQGIFADSWFKLYMFEVIFTVVGLIGFFALLIFISKKYDKRLFRKSKTNASEDKASAAISGRFTLLVPTYWIVSFVSTLLVGGITLAITMIVENRAFFDFINYDSSPVMSVFVLLVAGFVYLAAIFGPAIVVAAKYKWKAAVIVIALQLVWYTAAALIIIGFTN